jgi:PAS domain S-box-containing protein
MILPPGQEKHRTPPSGPAAVGAVHWTLQEDNEDWFRDLVEHSQDVLAVHDLEGRILAVNPTAARLTGYAAADLLKIPLRTLIAPEFHAEFNGYLTTVRTAGEARGFMAVITRSGQRRIWEYRAALSRAGKKPSSVHCVAHDVTAMVQEHRALRASNEALRQKNQEQQHLLHELQLFRPLLDNSNDAVQVIEPVTLRLLDVNQRTCLELGYTREELLQMTIFDISDGYSENDREAVMEQIKAAGFATVERIRRRKDGTTFPVEVTIREAHLDRTYGVVVSRDISQRKQSEEALRQREADLNRAQSVAHIGSWRFDLLQQTVSFSNETYRIIGLPIGFPLTPETAQAKIHFYDLPQLLADWRQALASGTLDAESRIWRYGEVRWVRTRAQFEYDAQGTPVLAVGTVQDITESKQAAQLLAEQEQRFHAMFDRSPIGIALTETATGRLLQVNARYCDIAGREAAELLSLDFQSITHPDDLARELELMRQFSSRQIAFFELEKRYLRPDGSIRWVKIMVVPAWSDEATPTTHLAMVKDITERKVNEARLREFERVVESAEELILVIDRDYRYTLVNSTFLRYWETTREHAIGRLVADVVTPELFEMLVKPNLDECFQGKVVHYEHSFHYPGMGQREMSVTYSPVEGPTGIERAACVVRDVTERKLADLALRQSEARERARSRELETVLETIPVAVFIARDAGCLRVTGNPAAYAQLGAPPGSNLSRTAPAGERAEFRVLENGAEVPSDLLPIQQSAATGRPLCNRPLTILLPDGSRKETITNVVPLFDDEGRPRGAVAASIDVTELKRTEEALRHSEARFRMLFERAPLGITLVDSEDLQFREVNPAYCEMLGRNADDMLRLTAKEITHPDDLQSALSAMRLLQTGTLPQVEVERRYLRPDGSLRWGRALTVPLFAPADPGPHLFLSMVEDITARKHAESALLKSESRFRAIYEYSPVGIALFDSETFQLGAVNPKFCEIAGCSPEQLRELSLQDDGQPGDFAFSPRQLQLLLSAQAGPAEIEKRFIRPDGSFRWATLVAAPLHGPGDRAGRLHVLLVQDITARKHAEEALRRSEQSYRAIYENSPLGIAVIDSKTGQYLQLNPRNCEFVGRTREELLQMTSDSITHPEDVAKNLEIRRHMAQGNAGVCQFEKRLLLPDGAVRWVTVLVSPLAEPGEPAASFLSIAQDVTDLKMAQAGLRQSEERFRVALAGSPIKVFNQDRDLRYTWVYNLQEGWSEKDYLGRTDEEIFGPEAGAIMSAIKRPVLQTGQRTRQEFTLETHGKKYYCDITVEPLHDAHDAVIGVNCACIDVTHLHEIADELRLAKEKLSEEKLYLEQSIANELGFGEIVGRSAALQAVMDQVAKVAPSQATVLLLGETGTGKELVARAIHRMSRYPDQPFIKLNCAAIPSGLLESELFGHEKGAFTGAVARKIGRLELADGGTLFLDEIGEIALDLQPKLLRVLQDHEFERLGGTHTIQVDFRLVAATNRDLWQSVTQRQFRSDLYYRLHVFPIRTPPLRDRREDIPLLVEHFVQKTSALMGKSITTIPSKAMEALMQWPWPGNIRELENLVERSVILSPGSVLQVPLSEFAMQDLPDRVETLRESDREHILEALRACNGRLGGPSGAAARLGMKRTTLQSRLNQLGIRPADFRRSS